MLTVICDLDDTLVYTSHQFRRISLNIMQLLQNYMMPFTLDAAEVQTEFERRYCAEMKSVGYYPGIDAKLWVDYGLELLDAHNVFGMNAEEIANNAGMREIFVDRIRNKANYFRYLHYPIADGAQAFLDGVSATGSQLICLTTGEEEMQLKKLNQVGLCKYFNDVIVVNGKKRDEIAKYVAHGPTIMVGNSRHSDIVPALQVGAAIAVLVRHKGIELAWSFDRQTELPNDGRVLIVDNLMEAIPAIQSIANEEKVLQTC